MKRLALVSLFAASALLVGHAQAEHSDFSREVAFHAMQAEDADVVQAVQTLQRTGFLETIRELALKSGGNAGGISEERKAELRKALRARASKALGARACARYAEAAYKVEELILASVEPRTRFHQKQFILTVMGRVSITRAKITVESGWTGTRLKSVADTKVEAQAEVKLTEQEVDALYPEVRK